MDPLSGKVMMGAFPTLAPYLFPLVMPALSTELERVKWYLIEAKTAELIEQLKAGEIDVTIMADPIDEPMLESLPLFEDEFLLATSKQHPLAKCKAIDAKQLPACNILLLEDGHCLRDQALEVCTMLGTSEMPDFRATSLETLRQMVATSDSVTLMPKIAMHANDELTYIPIKGAALSRSIRLYWRKTSARRKLFEVIASAIKSVMNKA
jgi:LysR family hydrogen peroxide-inducible transcriptional activator